MNVEAENAVMRERARIREAVIRISDEEGEVQFNGEVLIPRSEVLKAISG